MKVHPLAIVFGIATGTLLAGIIGALLAVPIVAVVATVSGYLSGGETETGPDRTRGPGDPGRHRPRRLAPGRDVGAEVGAVEVDLPSRV